MPIAGKIESLISEFSKRTPVRAGSLIISLFGDSISQHGNMVWLGSIIDVLRPFGLNPRQIRTAVFRLVQENWLQSQQHGRKSYYSFTEFGVRHYEKAARRIYAAGREDWDGNWTLVVPAFIEASVRDELRKELHWLGYGAIANGVMAHPSGDRQSLDETLLEMGITEDVVVLQSRTEDVASRECIKRLVQSTWRLTEIQQRYDSFLAGYRPLMLSLNKNIQPENQHCFLIRTLLIHEYRRILLSDADLPDELLPLNWSGSTAHDLTANLYEKVHQGAMRYICENMETIDGNLPGAGKKYYARFGKLSRA